MASCLVAAGAFGSLDCGDDASCESVCDNVLDKCGGTADVDNVARNACLEECAQRTQSVPSSCASEADAILVCLADAESLDCADPQASAACTGEAEALDACALGGGDSGSAGTGAAGTGGAGPSTTGAGGGEPCDADEQCPGGLCNLDVDRCRDPGALGDPCFRDEECANGLCNSETDVCAEPAALGEPCFSDDECANGLCNAELDVCAEPGGAGDPCFRDDECESAACSDRRCA